MTVISTVHRPTREGSTLTWSRRCDEAELREYDALVEREPDGAGLLPDLLVIAPLTKLGGDLDPAAPAACRADSLQFRGLRTLPVVFPAAS